MYPALIELARNLIVADMQLLWKYCINSVENENFPQCVCTESRTASLFRVPASIFLASVEFSAIADCQHRYLNFALWFPTLYLRSHPCFSSANAVTFSIPCWKCLMSIWYSEATQNVVSLRQCRSFKWGRMVLTALRFLCKHVVCCEYGT